MSLSTTELKSLENEHRASVERMVKCLEHNGVQKTNAEVVSAWASYSDSVMAAWLTPPDDDAKLLATLLKHLPCRNNAPLRAALVAASDGSGDLILTLPAELAECLNWHEGDELSVEAMGKNTVEMRRARPDDR